MGARQPVDVKSVLPFVIPIMCPASFLAGLHVIFSR